MQFLSAQLVAKLWRFAQMLVQDKVRFDHHTIQNVRATDRANSAIRWDIGLAGSVSGSRTVK